MHRPGRGRVQIAPLCSKIRIFSNVWCTAAQFVPVDPGCRLEVWHLPGARWMQKWEISRCQRKVYVSNKGGWREIDRNRFTSTRGNHVAEPFGIIDILITFRTSKISTEQKWTSRSLAALSALSDLAWKRSSFICLHGCVSQPTGRSLRCWESGNHHILVAEILAGLNVRHQATRVYTRWLDSYQWTSPKSKKRWTMRSKHAQTNKCTNLNWVCLRKAGTSIPQMMINIRNDHKRSKGTADRCILASSLLPKHSHVLFGTYRCPQLAIQYYRSRTFACEREINGISRATRLT